jgi:hypothetical protein
MALKSGTGSTHMRLSTRQRLILQQLEGILSPNSLSWNPFLVSQIDPRNTLHFKELCTLPTLLNLKSADYEVIQ